MKIAIDVQTTLGQPTGFGFYVSNLVNYLQKQNTPHTFELIEPQSSQDFSTPQRLIWDQFRFPAIAKNKKVDLIHQPCFSAPFSFSGPVVITIHDIISLLFPENIPFASRMFYSKWMPFSYSKATKIITISESTKNDIVRVLRIPEEKITVIPLAVDDKFRKPAKNNEVKEVAKKYNIKNDYILHIGTLEPRKNLGFLIDVFSEVIQSTTSRDLSLVITGKKGWYYEDLFDKVRKLNLEGKVIFTGYIDEADKPALYKGAKIFAFPSIYEGFGLPPLEAMASGIPVISSNTSSMGEVVGEAGILLSPKDQKEWVKAIRKVNETPQLRLEMVGKNKEQVRKFSWEKTAQKTIEVYEEAFEQFKK